MSVAVAVVAPEGRERPILFSAPMVRALLAGTKTQTRRRMKPQPEHGAEYASKGFDPPCALHLDYYGNPIGTHTCPYGVPGDRLWVRETWGYRSTTWWNRKPDELTVSIAYQADDSRADIKLDVPCGERPPGQPRQRCGKDCDGDPGGKHGDELRRYWASWRPSIYMPRWASRLLLEVTAVRVQRVQEISREDALAEGMDPLSIVYPTDQYADLWDAINGAGSWKANPWVWAVSFRRVA